MYIFKNNKKLVTYQFLFEIQLKNFNSRKDLQARCLLWKKQTARVSFNLKQQLLNPALSDSSSLFTALKSNKLVFFLYFPVKFRIEDSFEIQLKNFNSRKDLQARGLLWKKQTARECHLMANDSCWILPSAIARVCSLHSSLISSYSSSISLWSSDNLARSERRSSLSSSCEGHDSDSSGKSNSEILRSVSWASFILSPWRPVSGLGRAIDRASPWAGRAYFHPRFAGLPAMLSRDLEVPSHIADVVLTFPAATSR